MHYTNKMVQNHKNLNIVRGNREKDRIELLFQTEEDAIKYMEWLNSDKKLK